MPRKVGQPSASVSWVETQQNIKVI